MFYKNIWTVLENNIDLLSDTIHVKILDEDYVFSDTHNNDDLTGYLLEGIGAITWPTLNNKEFIASNTTGLNTVLNGDDVIFEGISASAKRGQYIVLIAEESGQQYPLICIESLNFLIPDAEGKIFLYWSDNGIFDIGQGTNSGGVEHNHNNKAELNTINQSLSKTSNVEFSSVKLQQIFTPLGLTLQLPDVNVVSINNIPGDKLANKDDVVHKANSETITGNKTLNGNNIFNGHNKFNGRTEILASQVATDAVNNNRLNQRLTQPINGIDIQSGNISISGTNLGTSADKNVDIDDEKAPENIVQHKNLGPAAYREVDTDLNSLVTRGAINLPEGIDLSSLGTMTNQDHDNVDIIGGYIETQRAKFKLGDKGPAGGVIIYVSADPTVDGFEYIELGGENLDPAIWTNPLSDPIKYTEYGIVEGINNSTDIMDASENVGQDNYGAFKAYTYINNQYSRWTIPSKDLWEYIQDFKIEEQEVIEETDPITGDITYETITHTTTLDDLLTEYGYDSLENAYWSSSENQINGITYISFTNHFDETFMPLPTDPEHPLYLPAGTYDYKYRINDGTDWVTKSVTVSGAGDTTNLLLGSFESIHEVETAELIDGKVKITLKTFGYKSKIEFDHGDSNDLIDAMEQALLATIDFKNNIPGVIESKGYSQFRFANYTITPEKEVNLGSTTLRLVIAIDGGIPQTIRFTEVYQTTWQEIIDRINEKATEKGWAITAYLHNEQIRVETQEGGSGKRVELTRWGVLSEDLFTRLENQIGGVLHQTEADGMDSSPGVHSFLFDEDNLFPYPIALNQPVYITNDTHNLQFHINNFNDALYDINITQTGTITTWEALLIILNNHEEYDPSDNDGNEGIVYQVIGNENEGFRHFSIPEDQDGLEEKPFMVTPADISTGFYLLDGRKNTDDIIIANDEDNAAKFCKDLTLGKNDWYLPSLEELLSVYENKNLLDISHQDKMFWSSTRGNVPAYDDLEIDGFIIEGQEATFLRPGSYTLRLHLNNNSEDTITINIAEGNTWNYIANRFEEEGNDLEVVIYEGKMRFISTRTDSTSKVTLDTNSTDENDFIYNLKLQGEVSTETQQIDGAAPGKQTVYFNNHTLLETDSHNIPNGDYNIKINIDGEDEEYIINIDNSTDPLVSDLINLLNTNLDCQVEFVNEGSGRILFTSESFGDGSNIQLLKADTNDLFSAFENNNEVLSTWNIVGETTRDDGPPIVYPYQRIQYADIIQADTPLTLAGGTYSFNIDTGVSQQIDIVWNTEDTFGDLIDLINAVLPVDYTCEIDSGYITFKTNEAYIEITDINLFSTIFTNHFEFNTVETTVFSTFDGAGLNQGQYIIDFKNLFINDLTDECQLVASTYQLNITINSDPLEIFNITLITPATWQDIQEQINDAMASDDKFEVDFEITSTGLRMTFTNTSATIGPDSKILIEDGTINGFIQSLIDEYTQTYTITTTPFDWIECPSGSAFVVDFSDGSISSEVMTESYWVLPIRSFMSHHYEFTIENDMLYLKSKLLGVDGYAEFKEDSDFLINLRDARIRDIAYEVIDGTDKDNAWGCDFNEPIGMNILPNSDELLIRPIRYFTQNINTEGKKSTNLGNAAELTRTQLKKIIYFRG